MGFDIFKNEYEEEGKIMMNENNKGIDGPQEWSLVISKQHFQEKLESADAGMLCNKQLLEEQVGRVC